MKHLETNISDLLRDMRNDLEDEGCREVFDQEKEYYFSRMKSLAVSFARTIVEQSVPERDPVKPSCWQVAQEDFRSKNLSNADNLLK